MKKENEAQVGKRPSPMIPYSIGATLGLAVGISFVILLTWIGGMVCYLDVAPQWFLILTAFGCGALCLVLVRPLFPTADAKAILASVVGMGTLLEFFFFYVGMVDVYDLVPSPFPDGKCGLYGAFYVLGCLILLVSTPSLVPGSSALIAWYSRSKGERKSLFPWGLLSVVFLASLAITSYEAFIRRHLPSPKDYLTVMPSTKRDIEEGKVVEIQGQQAKISCQWTNPKPGTITKDGEKVDKKPEKECQLTITNPKRAGQTTRTWSIPYSDDERWALALDPEPGLWRVAVLTSSYSVYQLKFEPSVWISVYNEQGLRIADLVPNSRWRFQIKHEFWLCSCGSLLLGALAWLALRWNALKIKRIESAFSDFLPASVIINDVGERVLTFVLHGQHREYSLTPLHEVGNVLVKKSEIADGAAQPYREAHPSFVYAGDPQIQLHRSFERAWLIAVFSATLMFWSSIMMVWAHLHS
jgi:hypothetical protein